MAFTALNSTASKQNGTGQTPAWLKTDFSQLPPEIVESIAALWNGEPQALNTQTTQKVISAFRTYIHQTNDRIQTLAKGPESPSRKRALEGADDTSGSQEKKARIAVETRPSTKARVSDNWTGTRFEGVSFTIPQRKKLNLRISGSEAEGIWTQVSGSDQVEFGIPWSEIEYVFCLPTPEKTQAQTTFIVMPKGVDGLSDASSSAYETLVWTAADTKAKGVPDEDFTQAQSISSVLSRCCTPTEPNPKDFTSEIPPAGGKKGDKAYHIKAFRGSKDGFLFLLPNGIIWAFKKPLIFFSFASIESISYTSVLARTFNLVISARSTNTAASETADYEFSMLDQADFNGIDAYVKANGLEDASLAEQRRAKVYNVNGKKGEAADPDAETGDGVGELEKAAREAEAQVQDSDDEEDDENFDPGSEGESGGSGSESEEEDDGNGDGDAGDVVREELGSEAEDVEMSDDNA